MESFKAYRVHTVDGKPVCKFEKLTLAELDPGAVLIKVAFSAITYKDAMAARGVGKNVRTDRPCVTGVDLSGEVVSSEDPRFKQGDKVIVNGLQKIKPGAVVKANPYTADASKPAAQGAAPVTTPAASPAPVAAEKAQPAAPAQPQAAPAASKQGS